MKKAKNNSKKKLNPLEIILLNYKGNEKDLNKFDKFIKQEKIKLLFK